MQLESRLQGNVGRFEGVGEGFMGDERPVQNNREGNLMGAQNAHTARHWGFLHVVVTGRGLGGTKRASRIWKERGSSPFTNPTSSNHNAWGRCVQIQLCVFVRDLCVKFARERPNIYT